MTGVEVVVERLSKSFGRANIWSDVALTLPPGEVSVLLGPSGTGRSVPTLSPAAQHAIRTSYETDIVGAGVAGGGAPTEVHPVGRHRPWS